MLEIDKPLLDMITGALAEIRAWVEACGGGWFTLDDINWDSPAAIPESPTVDPAIMLKASHSIGFICGVAAGLNVTPLSLLWAIGEDTETPIAAINAKSKPTPPKLAAGAPACPKCRAALRSCATGDDNCGHCDACGWAGNVEWPVAPARPVSDKRRRARQHAPTRKVKP